MSQTIINFVRQVKEVPVTVTDVSSEQIETLERRLEKLSIRHNSRGELTEG